MILSILVILNILKHRIREDINLRPGVLKVKQRQGTVKRWIFIWSSELEKGEIIAVEVGGAGTKEQKGYNGGGISGTANVGGGGASDIRVGSYSLYDRILVAGGGGSVGAASRGGAAGGGTLGLSSKQNYGSGGQGGTQTEAGLYGDFGVGGNGLYQNNGRGGAGGGGWYGGGGVRPDRSVDDDRGGGGGSGYIFTSNSYKPEGYDVDERYYLTEATTISGNAQLPDKMAVMP